MIVNLPRGNNQYRKRHDVSASGTSASLVAQAALGTANQDGLNFLDGPPDDRAVAQALATMSWSDDPGVRITVAGHPLCPLPVLERLGGDERSDVCVAVAGNPRCSSELLDRLARRNWEGVSGGRQSEVLIPVIKNPNTAVETLLYVGTLDRPGNVVHEALAGCPRCPPEVLGRLVDCASDGGRYTALSHPACPAEKLHAMAVVGIRSDRSAVARNPVCPPELLEKLARDSNKSVKYDVASNPATPPETLIRLIRDRDGGVRVAARNNPSLPPAALAMWQLAHDGAV